MSPSIPAKASNDGTLQRGKACLSCRRRKMKCDGGRPHCTQCVRGNRAEDCEYTDNQGRTRTQMLEEHVTLLQARIHELEHPRAASRSVHLYDPYVATRTPASQVSQSPATSWWEFEEPPAQITEMLVGIFMPHAASLGFALSTRHFLSDLSLPALHRDRPHPALLHTVFLWALHISKSYDLMQHENLFLQRSILALQDALGHESGLEDWVLARRRLQAIQAEVLLAQYFFSLGRLVEGRYHANAAVSLAVGCGLHRLRPLSHHDLRARESAPRSSFGTLELTPPRNELEYGERIRVFWAVYVLDRCWSAALSIPCVLTDDAVLGTQIDSDWPMATVDYERPRGSPSDSLRGDGTIHRFLSGEHPNFRDDALSQETLRVMASTMYERATRLSHQWFSQSSQSPSRTSLLTDMQSIARTTMQFARRLTPVDQLSVGGQESETLLVVHGLAHASMLTLHRVRASDAPAGDLNAIHSALVHASEIIQVLEILSGNESALLDPILGIIGFLAARIFIQEEQRMRQLSEREGFSPSSSNRLTSLQASITRITDVLRRCVSTSDSGDIFGQQVDKILEMLGDL